MVLLMNLKRIQEKLNELFKGNSRQLVFWYDDNVSFLKKLKILN